MGSPLTPEIIEELKSISQLSVEEQKKVLPSFLKKLTPEQIEYNKNQQLEQQEECLFCSMVNGNIKIKKVYEDLDYLAFLDIKPANPGHTLVIPKEHIQFSTHLTNPKIFDIANRIADSIYKNLGKNTNIFVANGTDAGQRLNHLAVHVIPRDKGDGVTIGWQGKEVKEDELDKIASKIRIEIKEKEPEKEEKADEFIEYDDLRIP